MREPGYWEFRVRQGRTFNPTLTWRDDAGVVINLTGWDAVMQIRTDPDDPNIVQELTVGGGIMLGGTLGTLALFLSAADTADMKVDRYAYSLKVVSPGGIEDDLLVGPFVVDEEVTR